MPGGILRWISVLLALVLTACAGGGGGGGGGGGNGGSPDPNETVEPTGEPTQQGGQPVGRVIQVINSLTLVGGERAAGGDPLFAGSRMTTDTQGRATFSVRDILEDCQVQSDSDLTVSPSDSTPLELDRGSLICRSKPGEDEFQVEAGEAIVEFLDPIFLLRVGAQTDVRVDFGFVQVRQRDRAPGPAGGSRQSDLGRVGVDARPGRTLPAGDPGRRRRRGP
jgi:hypothetical protein